MVTGWYGTHRWAGDIKVDHPNSQALEAVVCFLKCKEREVDPAT